VIKQNVRSGSAVRRPASLGTEIRGAETLEQYPVKASAIRSRRCSPSRRGMLGVPGIAARTFAAVHHEGISVSTHHAGLVRALHLFSVPEESAQRARRSPERHSSGKSRGKKSTASRRAPGSRRSWWWGSHGETPGIAARVFSALAEAGST